MAENDWDLTNLTAVARRFWDDPGKFVTNLLSVKRLIETQDVATERLKAFQIDINKSAGTRHKTGKPKKLDRAKNKANTDYDGDMQRVTDYARGKMIVDSPDQVRAITAMLDDKNSDLLREHGICVVSKRDYFAEPKEQTGYRCINYKLAVPVGEDENFDVERQVVELQVVASQIEKINSLTHPFKRRGEDIHTRAVDEGRDPDQDEAYEMHLCFATSRYYNGLVSGNNGYDELLKPSQRGKFEMTPTRRHNHLKFVRDLQELDRRRDDLGDYIAKQAAPADPGEIKAGLDDETGHWIRYGIYRAAGRDPEFFRETLVRDPNDTDAKSKPVDELTVDDFVVFRAMRWDFEEEEWDTDRQALNKLNSSNYSTRYSSEEFHERMLRHESTLVRRYFEQSGILDGQGNEQELHNG